VEVSSGEDDMAKKSANDDTGDVGASSAEPIAPIPIRFDALRQTDPSATDRAASIAPPVGGHMHERAGRTHAQASPARSQAKTCTFVNRSSDDPN
jgi:hypothetical protein